MKLLVFLSLVLASPNLWAFQMNFSGHGVNYRLQFTNQMIQLKRGSASYSDQLTSCNKKAYTDFWQGLKKRFKNEQFIKGAPARFSTIRMGKKAKHVPRWSQNLSYFLQLESSFIHLLTLQKRKCRS